MNADFDPDGLVEFFTDRLDEDAEFLESFMDAPSLAERRRGGQPMHVGGFSDGHQVRNVEADRRLLARYTLGQLLMPGQYKGGYCEALEEAIAIRAARYADHANWQQRWAVWTP